MKKLEESCQCNIRDKKSFAGWNDYHAFFQIIETSNLFKKVPVEKFLYSVNFEENWYCCTLCDKVWRLIEPDPPYAGQWQLIEDV